MSGVSYLGHSMEFLFLSSLGSAERNSMVPSPLRICIYALLKQDVAFQLISSPYERILSFSQFTVSHPAHSNSISDTSSEIFSV